MPFTPLSLQGRFFDTDGSPASGTICVTPESGLLNTVDGTYEQTRDPVCGVLDSEGRIATQGLVALQLCATDDTGTTPVGSAYTFTLKLDGQSVVEFSSPVPHAPSAFESELTVVVTDEHAVSSVGVPVVTLVDTLASPAMIGGTVTASQFSGTPTVESVDEVANTITLSSNATGSGLCTVEFASGAVSFAGLQANAL